MMKVQHAAISDIGRMRKENEDRLLVDTARGLFAVADGIGGLPHGAQAAQMTIERILRSLPPVANAPSMLELQQAVQAANHDVLASGQRLNPPQGIGSTLTLACVSGRQLNLLHVGDSRCYIWRRGRFTQATADHTVEHDPHFLRRYGMDSSLYERQRGALTRCIGQVERIEIESHLIDLDAEDRVLLATDGLFRPFSEEELSDLVGQAKQPQACLEALVETANSRGGMDNATGILIFVN